MLKTEISSHARERQGARTLLDFRVRVEHLKDPVHGSHAIGQDQVQLGKPLDRLKENGQVPVEGYQRSDRQASGPHLHRAVPEDNNRPDRGQESCHA